MDDLSDPATFRAGVRAKYRDEFRLHLEVAEALEQAIASKRSLTSNAHVALDMFMTQAYKSHFGVWLMAERAQAEDAATLTRRLMELSIQAIYIGGDDSPQTVAHRAGCYLAGLWRSVPDELRTLLPADHRAAWQAILEEFGRHLPKSKGWGPTFRDMFEEADLLDAYQQDYSLLSAIAHGSMREAALHYSVPVVDLRSDLHVPVLLIFATRYYLAVADIWNRYFGVLDPSVLSAFVQRGVNMRDKPTGAA
jgi:hypothetical protein